MYPVTALKIHLIMIRNLVVNRYMILPYKNIHDVQISLSIMANNKI